MCKINRKAFILILLYLLKVNILKVKGYKFKFPIEELKTV